MVTVTVMKHSDQKLVGERKIYLASNSISLVITKEGEDRKSNPEGYWRQGLMYRS